MLAVGQKTKWHNLVLPSTNYRSFTSKTVESVVYTSSSWHQEL